MYHNTSLVVPPRRQRSTRVVPSMFLLAGLLAGLIAGCAHSDTPAPSGSSTFATTTQGLDETKATGNGMSELRVRTADFTLWFSPQVDASLTSGARVFTLNGRSSVPLAALATQGATGSMGKASLLPDSRFRLQLQEFELLELLTGAPLLIHVQPQGEIAPTFARVELAGRYVAAQGATDSLVVDPSILGFLSGGELVFRTYASLVGAVAQPAVQGPPQAVPALRAQGENRYQLEYSPERLLQAVYTPDPIVLSAVRNNATVVSVSLRARIALREVSLAVDLPALTAEALGCSADVQKCVETVPGCTQGDTEACGLAWDVGRCRVELACAEGTDINEKAGQVFGTDPYSGIEEHFPADLAAYLAQYYAANAEAIALAGGVSLNEALSFIDPSLVEEIVNPNDDPAGNDLEAVRVLRHPDVIFPGSGRYWYGVYSRTDSSPQDFYTL